MIGRRERWCYGAGDLGFNFVWQSTELYLLFFYIRVLHLTPALASAIFLAGAVIDWVADPLVGMLADRAGSRLPMRTWVLAGGPLTVLALVAVFTPPPLPAAMVPYAAFASYLLLRVTYSIGNIPYAALTARLSDRPRDHLALTGTRMQGAALGGLIAGGIYALLRTRSGTVDFQTGTLLLAGLSLPAFLATGFGVTERVTAMGDRPAVASPAIIGLLRRSAPLRRLLAVIVTAGLTVTVIDKSLLFLFEAMGIPRTGYLVALVPSASLLVTGNGWSWFGAHWGTTRVLTMAAGMMLAATLASLLAPVPAVVVPLTCLAIAAGCGLSVMFWSMVPGTVAACEALSDGQSCAGRVYALANVARKFAGAMGPVVITSAIGGTPRALLVRIAASAALAMITVLACRPWQGSTRETSFALVDSPVLHSDAL